MNPFDWGETEWRLASGVVALPNERNPDEVLIGRVASRQRAKSISSDLWEFLQLFRMPKSLVAGVVQFSSSHQLDAEEMLEAVWPALRDLIEASFLIRDGSPDVEPVEPVFGVGRDIGGLRVQACVRVMEDTQLFLATRGNDQFAIKAVVNDSAECRARLMHEFEVLEHLDGSISPKPILHSDGVEHGVPFIVMSWVTGQAVASLAQIGSRADRIRTATQIVEAYERLHTSGILHGDVNAGNVMISAMGPVLLDFGAAQYCHSLGPDLFGAVEFRDPEWAKALLASRPTPALSVSAETYAIGVLLFFLITGRLPRTLSIGLRETIEEIAHQPPLRFREVGCNDLSSVARVIERSIAQVKQERFDSPRDLHKALVSALPAANPTLLIEGAPLLTTLTKALSPGGAWFEMGLPATPKATVNTGAAGTALGLLEMARDLDDPGLLRLADHWLDRALAMRSDPLAFADEDGLIKQHVEQDASFLHSEFGIHWVGCHVAKELGDAGRLASSIESMLGTVSASWKNPDLALGRAGVLAIMSSVLEISGSDFNQDVVSFGCEVADELWSWQASAGPIARDSLMAPAFNLGMAHGWAGFLWATARWSLASGTAPPEDLRSRTHELIAQAVERNDGRLEWPWWSSSGRDLFVRGWCNGAAGIIMCLTDVFTLTQDDAFLEAAIRAAIGINPQSMEIPHLCCGAAGAGIALGRLGCVTGFEEHQNKAIECIRTARRTLANGFQSGSLMRGEVGVAVVECNEQSLAALRWPGFASVSSH